MPAADRSSQGKTMPRSAAKVYFIGHNHTDHTVTLAIHGQRYEYFLNPSQCNTVEFLCRKGLARRALNYAKSHAWTVLKVQTLATSTS